MAHKKQVEDVLKDLFKRRTHWLTDGLFSINLGISKVVGQQVKEKILKYGLINISAIQKI